MTVKKRKGRGEQKRVKYALKNTQDDKVLMFKTVTSIAKYLEISRFQLYYIWLGANRGSKMRKKNMVLKQKWMIYPIT